MLRKELFYAPGFTSCQTIFYSLSIFSGLLMAVLSTAGLLNAGNLYATIEMRETFLPNDIVNLVLGMPILIGSVVMTRRGSLAGLLLWPGALLYIIYNYTAYLVGMPLRWITFLYLALVLLCAVQVVFLIAGMDHPRLREQLSGKFPEKLTAGVLVFFGGAFLILAVSEIIHAVSGDLGLTAPDLGVRAADILVSILWITGGILLFRKVHAGYSSAPGLLFAASVLFVGLILFLLLRPVLSAVPFDAGELVVVLVMSLVCFVPFGLLVRGIWKADAGI